MPRDYVPGTMLFQLLDLLGHDLHKVSPICFYDCFSKGRYTLVSMHHGKVGCLIIDNCNMHMVREIEDRFVLDHGEGAFWILKSLEIHEIILRDQ